MELYTCPFCSRNFDINSGEGHHKRGCFALTKAYRDEIEQSQRGRGKGKIQVT